MIPSFPVPIIASGTGWLAVEKPSGMSVHNAPGMDLCSTMADHIKGDPALAESLSFDSDFGLNPVHRLDQETSGVILLACTRECFRYFSVQFQNRRVIKRYAAIVHGRIKAEVGLWIWPLSKDAGGRNNPAGVGKKLPCQTRFKVLRHTEHYTLIDCELLTGRKHQIRRHAKLAGHPVIGDTRYGTSRSVQYLKTTHNFNRLGLHSMSINICPPNESKHITILSNGLPPEMEELLNTDSPGL